ncbi:MAG: T9SS type A sorting domain-containing protein [Ignavibacteria bacterium]|nr:T9SS type A sorting domain-containing protein [Ignavibacteria bacterium]
MKTLREIFDLNRLSTILLYTSIISFIIAFNFSDNPPVSGWQQQFMPFLNNMPLADITFLDSLTGYAVTGTDTGVPDTNYILKTTNSGYNWNVILSRVYSFRKVIFLNLDTGYASNIEVILRTTNGGKSWENIPVPPDYIGIFDIFPVSYDTMWITLQNFGLDYIYRTTNAGLNWTRQIQGNSFDKLYFFNNRIGFVGSPLVNVFLKTTNSGINWTPISGNGFKELYFTDSLTGWNARGSMKKTIDGGETWINQIIPQGGNIITSSMETFSNINNDTIWGGGGYIRLGSTFRGMLYRTTNGGTNWVYQVPDTSFRISIYDFVNFSNKFIGWAYKKNTLGIYTNAGGDTAFVTNIKTENNFLTEDYVLYQNYPNPFNPKTIISYELETSSSVSIKVFDILGKEINELINKKQNPGKYEIDFDGSALSSGVYFYSLVTDGVTRDTKKMLLIR